MDVWVPYRELAESAPPGISISMAYFSGEGAPPGPPESVEFWAMPHPLPPAARELLPRMTGLRVAQLVSSGFDHVAGWLPDGVTLCNAPHLRASGTAEAAMCLMLAMLNDVPTWVENQRARIWRYLGPRRALAGRSLLLVGYGAVGRELHRMLRGFGVRVTPVGRRACSEVVGSDELAGLLPEADVVVLAAPLTELTRGMIGPRMLAALKPGALLVNVSRGELVDTAALAAELATGRISAALDVTDPEPLAPDHPLWDCPNLLISPHVGGGVAGLEERASAFVREQLDAYIKGAPLAHVVSVGHPGSAAAAPPVDRADSPPKAMRRNSP